MAKSTSRKLFISYSHEDGEPFARQLSTQLLAAGHQPWRDHERLTSQGGVRWSREITRQVLTADVVLVVMTPQANESQYVEAEWMKALEYQRPIVPLMFLSGGIPLPLTPLQFIDFRTDFNKGFNSLLDRLTAIDRPEGFLERDHQTLEALRALRSTVGAGQHAELDGLISELVKRIENYQENVQTQTVRVEQGLAEIKARAVEEATRPMGPGIRKYGRRPPTPLDGFRDRVESQIEIAQALADTKVRMVSVLGRGGMGKTALACYVLNNIESGRWPGDLAGPQVQGVAYLQNAPTQPITLDRILLYIAKVLPDELATKAERVFNNRDLSTEDRVERILEVLSSELVIVLLDNFEDLLDERGRLRDADIGLFLRKSMIGPHSLKLLITARAPINLSVAELRAERQVQLRDGLPEVDAIALLKELDPNHYLGLSTAQEADLQRLVSLTHGIPRALELVASILKGDDDMAFLLCIDDVANEFYSRENVVQKLVEVNYATLRPEARRVIEALAVFGRPVPPVAIDFLLQPYLPGLQLAQILQPIVNARLVSFERGRDGKPGTLGLHPIDRDFLYRRLPSQGSYSRTDLHIRAAEYYRTQRTHGVNNWKELPHLMPQLLEFEHLVSAGMYDDAAILLGEYGPAVSWCGHPTLCRNLHRKLPTNLKSAHAIISAARAEVVWKMFLGPLPDAIRIGEHALQLAILRENSDWEMSLRYAMAVAYRFSYNMVLSLQNTQWVYQRLIGKERLLVSLDLVLALVFSGDVKAAQPIANEAVELAASCNETKSWCTAWSAMIVYQFACRNYKNAMAVGKKAEKIWEPNAGDGLAYVKNLIGLSLFFTGDYPGAVSKLMEARTAADEYDSPRSEALVLWNLSIIHTLHGVFDKALECGKEAEILLTRLSLDRSAHAPRTAADSAIRNDHQGLINAFLLAADESTRCGDLFPGRELIERACEIARRFSLTELLANCQKVLAGLTARLILPETGGVNNE